LNGFVGEFPILVGAYAKSSRFATLAAMGMILGACYLMWMLRNVVFGPLHEPLPHSSSESAHTGDGAIHGSVPPVGWHEIAGLSPLMVLIVAIGVYPRPYLEQMRSAVGPISETVRSQRALVSSPAAPRPTSPIVALSGAAKLAARSGDSPGAGSNNSAARGPARPEHSQSSRPAETRGPGAKPVETRL
jgi:NADH-quinone oxidoreductase subunit M